MQSNNHNANISVSQPTIIQVAKSNSTSLLQNGQHLLIGKLGLEQNSASANADNQSGQTSSNQMQAIYPLQYIETGVANSSATNQANSDGNSYGSVGNKIFYQDGHSASIYTSMSGQTATIIPASSIQARDLSSQLAANVGSAVHIQGAPHAQIVHHGGNAYLVQSAARIEDDSPNLSHTTKASPVTVQWLCDNYETADGVSLPRSTLYNHYLQHCQQEKLEPMNQASFGKLIRSVFFGLRTRRLGTRGNSKYHYYGIRIKPNSVLNHYVEDQTFAMRQYPSFHRQSADSDFHWRASAGKYSNHGLGAYGSGGVGGSTPSGLGSGGGGGSSSSILIMNNAGGGASSNGAGGPGGATGDCVGGNNQHSNYLGESSSALPNLGDIIGRAELDTLTEDECLHEGVSLDDINVFCQMYLDHSDAVLSAVVYLNFKYIETLWQEFWRTSAKSQSSHLEEKLPKVQLHRLLKIPQVQSFLQLFDNMFYQSLVEVLIPNVLRPIPSALTQNIRHFAKSLESWMAAAIAGLNAEIVQIKMSCVCALAQTLRRHTSLNHLAQAARAVLKNASQISQMLTDLNRVDFTNVQEQASWVCGCDNKRIDALQQEFKRILQQQASLEEWATWLDHVVTDVLEPYKATPQYPSAAHQFILKWSFYSSMVIRDLTLRSAASFGSFHLIRLLYDEYIYYLVEQKVAEHLNLSPVAVTGEMGRQLMASDSANYGHIQLQSELGGSAALARGSDPLGAAAGKTHKFKIEHGLKKETSEIVKVVGASGTAVTDYGSLISYNAGGTTVGASSSRLLNMVGLNSLAGSASEGGLGAIDMDYHRISGGGVGGASSVLAGGAGGGGTESNQSGGMTDDQVDESADDDEGLDEDFQTNEPLQLSMHSVQLHQQQQQQQEAKQGALASQPVVHTIKKLDPPTIAIGMPSNQQTTSSTPRQPVSSIIGVSSGISSGVRKTVNVTTFGEPVASAATAAATSSSSLSSSAVTTGNSANIGGGTNEVVVVAAAAAAASGSVGSTGAGATGTGPFGKVVNVINVVSNKSPALSAGTANSAGVPLASTSSASVSSSLQQQQTSPTAGSASATPALPLAAPGSSSALPSLSAATLLSTAVAVSASKRIKLVPSTTTGMTGMTSTATSTSSSTGSTNMAGGTSSTITTSNSNTSSSSNSRSVSASML